MPYRSYAPPSVTAYEGIDIEARTTGVLYIGDVQDMDQIATASYDVALCSEVLEHLPRPESAVAEIARVLKPAGQLLLSVPFLSRLHEEPNDFFRYTEHGLRTLLTRNGFVVVEIIPIGSVFSFLGHQVSTVLLAATYTVPGVRQLVFALNAALVVLPCRLLDRLPGLARKLPAGYVVLATKRQPSSVSDRSSIVSC
jgi:SAM-dependent methyltransferase